MRHRFVENAYLSVIGCPDPALRSGAVVIFSMDRAIQLHALLHSYFTHVANPVPVSVLYRATSDRHTRAYNEVLDEFKDRAVKPIRQSTRRQFRPALLQILRHLSCDKVIFLVDDIVFINAVDMAAFLTFDTRDFVPSLRLGEHLTRCYTVAHDQALPPFLQADGPYRTWYWRDGQFDWGYPLSVDGHVFGLAELMAFVEATEFETPNSFEASLQVYSRFFLRRRGVCFRESRIVNVPWNKVQADNPNLHGSVHQDDLLCRWEEGLRIHVEQFYGMTTESCHQELPLTLVPR
jgi:hypothetical protein